MDIACQEIAYSQWRSQGVKRWNFTHFSFMGAHFQSQLPKAAVFYCQHSMKIWKYMIWSVNAGSARVNFMPKSGSCKGGRLKEAQEGSTEAQEGPCEARVGPFETKVDEKWLVFIFVRGPFDQGPFHGQFTPIARALNAPLFTAPFSRCLMP